MNNKHKHKMVLTPIWFRPAGQCCVYQGLKWITLNSFSWGKFHQFAFVAKNRKIVRAFQDMGVSSWV